MSVFGVILGVGVGLCIKPFIEKYKKKAKGSNHISGERGLEAWSQSNRLVLVLNKRRRLRLSCVCVFVCMLYIPSTIGCGSQSTPVVCVVYVDASTGVKQGKMSDARTARVIFFMPSFGGAFFFLLMGK